MDRHTELLEKLKSEINLLVEFSPRAQEIIENLQKEGVIHIEVDLTATLLSRKRKEPSPFDKKWVGVVH